MQILGIEIRETSEVMKMNYCEFEAEMKIEDEEKIVYLTAIVDMASKKITQFATAKSIIELLSLLPDEEAYENAYNEILYSGIDAVFPDIDIEKRYNKQFAFLIEKVQEEVNIKFGNSDNKICNYTIDYDKPYYSPEPSDEDRELWDTIFALDMMNMEIENNKINDYIVKNTKVLTCNESNMPQLKFVEVELEHGDRRIFASHASACEIEGLYICSFFVTHESIMKDYLFHDEVFFIDDEKDFILEDASYFDIFNHKYPQWTKVFLYLIGVILLEDPGSVSTYIDYSEKKWLSELKLISKKDYCGDNFNEWF